MPHDPNAQLSLHGMSARVHAERTKQARLLERIARKRATLAQLHEGEHDARAELARAAPLVDEALELAREISRAFETMLGDPKRSKTQRKKIAEVHRLLVEIGVLEAPGAEGAGAAEGIGAELPLSEMGDDVQPGATVPSTRAAGASEDLTKALFKKLAEASHPDKASDESDRARRTEAMKRLTVAYRTGDLAALVELERALAMGAPISAATTDDEHAALKRVNAALRKQERALDREIRAARGSNAQLDATSAVARETLERYRTVHEFVIRFRDGKMSLAEFLEGPPLGPEEDDDSEELAGIAEHLQNGDFVELFELLDELTREATPARGRRRQKRG
ncbi:MAG: J domain-containing protein [Sandaracinaceae bacterium]|nr:J domain-containing protein [Sandaracinaceae bacterium]